MLNAIAAARAQGVRWTRPYLAALCDTIRQALEAWAGPDAGASEADAPDLGQARSAAGQLTATLETLSVPGAAGLAQALERALEKIEQPDAETATVLLECIAVLPDYLERLETGAPDLPGVLAQYASRARAVAGLEPDADDAAASPLDDDGRGDYGESDPTHLRRAYQRALRDWLKNSDDTEGLGWFAQKLKRSATPSLRRVGRAVEAAFRGLAGGQLRPGPDLQGHLAALDRLLHQWSDSGDSEAAAVEADGVAAGLLSDLEKAEPGCAEIDAIRERAAAAQPPDERELERARRVLAGRNRELFTAMAEAARGELNQAKDALNEFLLGQREEDATVSRQADVLRSVAESFSMLGLDRLAERVQDQANRLGELDADPENPALLEVARELLLVESELDEAVLYLGEVPESDLLEGDGRHLPRAEHRRVMRQLLSEALDDLGQAKHLLDQVYRDPTGDDSAEQADRILRRVAGVLRMAALDAAAEMLEASAACIAEEMVARPLESADRERLAGLAEAMVVVEFYLESLTRLDARGVEYLHSARERLMDLGYLGGREAEPAPETETRPEPAAEEAGPEAEAEFEHVEGEAAAPEPEPDVGTEDETRLPEPEEVPEADAALEAENALEAEEGFETGGTPEFEEAPETEVQTQAEKTLEPEAEETPGREPGAHAESGAEQGGPILADEKTAEPAAGEGPGSTGFEGGLEPASAEAAMGPAPEDADERDSAEEQAGRGEPEEADSALAGSDFDLMEIFLEEFDEELAALQQRLPRWRQDPTSQSLLTEIRRSFHTLKGSGRMAGAQEIGEFAWQVEQLLNQTLDGQYEPGDIVGVTGDAIEALPGLRARLIGEASDLEDVDIEAILARVLRVGEESYLPELEGLDPTLIRLMIKEIGDHLEIIDGWIETSRRETRAASVDRDLIRAVHTIKGTLRLAPIGNEADTMQLVEEYLQELVDTDAEPSDAAVDMLEDLRGMLGKRLDRLERRAVSTGHFETGALAEAARALISALHREADRTPTAASEDAELEQPAPAESAPEAPAPEAPEPEEADLEAPEPEAPEIEEHEPAVPEVETPSYAYPAEKEAPAERTAGGFVDVDYEALDADLLDLFLEEGQELLEHSDDLLQQWREEPEDRNLVTALQRNIHTVKGSARMAGLNSIGEVAHVLEDLLESIAAGQQEVSPAAIDMLESGCDHLHAMLDAVGRREPVPVRAIGADELEETEPLAEQAQTGLRETTEDDLARTGRSSTIRLASERVEELLNYAGEVSIFRSRIEQEIGAFRGNISEVEQTVARLREQLRKLEAETEAQILSRYEREHGTTDPTFDPLELDRYSTIQQLSRALAESVSDLNSLTELMDDAGRQSETLLMQQQRVNTELQEGLMQARMVSFSTLAPRLRRVVRNAARDAGRRAELRILMEGEGELDRNVLDRVTAPIEHMLRNAVAHGIEPPDRRRAAGKPETGTISIMIEREATELLIRIVDDGAGLDLERIRDRALELGLLTPGQAEDHDQLMQVIFRTGFSTAGELSELAGRGVGMDVVASEVRQVGGRVAVDSSPGHGTEFALRIPLSLAVMQAIFVEAGERLFAIPLQAVRGVARVQPAEWREALDSDGTYRYGGESYPLLELEPQIGFEPAEIEDASLSLLMIAAGDQRAALRVADIQGHREIVLKPVGPQISSIPGILGGTIMGDGQVVVILDMAPLIERALAEQRLPGRVAVYAEETPEEEVKRTPLVMVVDDSITMRRVTARILEHYGLEVVTARDGVDAVDMLYERVPDLMLLDIEMPRMDGFELATWVRDDTRLAGVPIMMITSRSGDKHREHARQLGVDRYLIKPYQEATMVRNVFEMLELPVPGQTEGERE